MAHLSSLFIFPVTIARRSARIGVTSFRFGSGILGFSVVHQHPKNLKQNRVNFLKKSLKFGMSSNLEQIPVKL